MSQRNRPGRNWFWSEPSRSPLSDFLTFCPKRGHTLPMGSFHPTFPSLCIHFVRLLDFSQKSNTTLQDYPYTQPHHSVTQELFLCGLFWKLSEHFGFHRNQCKKELIYGSAAPGNALFFETKFIYSRSMLRSFILCCFRFPKLSLMVCRNLRTNMLSRKLRLFACGSLNPP